MEEVDLPLNSLTPYFVAFCVDFGTALTFISLISSSETFAKRLLAAILFRSYILHSGRRTLLAEAFPCFRCFGCSRFVLVVSVPRKRPLQTAVWDSCWACARWKCGYHGISVSRVGNTMPPPEFAHVFMSQFSHGNDSHSPCWYSGLTFAQQTST